MNRYHVIMCRVCGEFVWDEIIYSGPFYQEAKVAMESAILRLDEEADLEFDSPSPYLARVSAFNESGCVGFVYITM